MVQRRVDSRYRLDVVVANEDPAVDWGIGRASAAVFGFFGALVVLLAVAQLTDLPGAVFTVAGYAAEVGILFIVAGPVARRAGGWAAAFGWGLPRRSDTGVVLLWLVIGYAAKLAVSAIVVITFPQVRDEFISNTPVSGVSIASLVVVSVVSVLIAPPIEELVFRGVALRGVMRRYGFTPAALTTSALFGLGHAWQEPTAASALLIASTLAAFGYAQCWLVRYTGRLGPAIAVHALNNALALGLALRTTGVLG